MSKANDQSLLIPSETGWEIWTRQGEGEFSLHQATEVSHPGDLLDLPAGELLMCFPVKAITALPMKVASDDDSLFEDLATLHAERLGLRPDPMAGQLTDLFVIERHPEATTLLEILLRTPREGEMPKRSPSGFDISPRAFDSGGHDLILWKEFGRWVFALHHEGKLIYCQATSNDASAPDAALAREIRLSLIQLEIQGMAAAIPSALVWSADPALDTRTFATAIGTRVAVAPRPAPTWPKPSSRLLPADVRAARREAAKKRTIIFAAAAVAAVYLLLIGWLGFSLWSDAAETKRLNAIAAASAPQGEAVALHNAKWDELIFATDLAHDPVDILLRTQRSMPPNTGLRLAEASISASQVMIRGEAPQSAAILQFSRSLTSNNELASFVWETPSPTASTRGSAFRFVGTSRLFGANP